MDSRLLDELARAFAHAAVEAFIREAEKENADDPRKVARRREEGTNETASRSE